MVCAEDVVLLIGLIFSGFYNHHLFAKFARLPAEPLRLPPRFPFPLQHLQRDQVLQRRRDVLEILGVSALVLQSVRPKVCLDDNDEIPVRVNV